MNIPEKDAINIATILNQVLERSLKFIKSIGTRPPGIPFEKPSDFLDLTSDGIGAEKALELFFMKYENGLSGSSGPRNFSFVTGGSTPAALAGDWLTSIFDLNLSNFGNSCGPWVEVETIRLLRQLIRLPDDFGGIFVTGATMSNFVGLAQGREWAAKEQGVVSNEDGIYALKAIPVLSGAIHSSSIKCLSMLGMGRKSHYPIQLMNDRECIDIENLEIVLQSLKGTPCIVVANAGTVNTGDFDPLLEIAELRKKYPFWLHVDAAFGGFLKSSSSSSLLAAGIECADSLTIDLHKWLNVPYDAAIALSRHPAIQKAVFQNHAAYLNLGEENPVNFLNLGPENSRRFRALPTWFNLVSYGKDTFTQIVDQNLRLAKKLGACVSSNPEFKLLSAVHSNIVCFGLERKNVDEFLNRIMDDGKVFFSKTTYQGQSAVRAAFVNWKTTDSDLDIAWDACLRAISK